MKRFLKFNVLCGMSLLWLGASMTMGAGLEDRILYFWNATSPTVMWERSKTQVTFRCPADTLLTNISTYVWNNTGAGIGTCELYEGVGITGKFIDSSTISAWSSNMTYSFNEVPLTANQWYTVLYYPQSGTYGDPLMVSPVVPNSSKIGEDGHGYAVEYGSTSMISEFSVYGKNTGSAIWVDSLEEFWNVSAVGISVFADTSIIKDGLMSIKIETQASGWPTVYMNYSELDLSQADNLCLWVYRTGDWAQGIYVRVINDYTYSDPIALIGSWWVTEKNVWTKVSIPLGSTPRNCVTQLQFYFNGAAEGVQTIYLDRLSAEKDQVQIPGDINGDGVVDSDDIDALYAAIAAGSTASECDLDGNGSVAKGDVDYLVQTLLLTVYGNANLDKSVDVGDLGILAANYGGTGKTWSQGDFNGDGVVDVGDLGILAANYGANSSTADWSTDYAKAFRTVVVDGNEDAEETSSTICSGLGLTLMAGLALMGLMMVRFEE